MYLSYCFLIFKMGTVILAVVLRCLLINIWCWFTLRSKDKICSELFASHGLLYSFGSCDKGSKALVMDSSTG